MKFSHLIPREVLALAIDVEEKNAQHYREWADRLQTYDSTASALLNTLAEQELEHEQRLIDMYSECYGCERIEMNADDLDLYSERAEVPMETYFVMDIERARAILKAALRAEETARKFYEQAWEQALEFTTDKELRFLYADLAKFEEEHVWALQKQLEHLEAQAEMQSKGPQREAGKLDVIP